MLTFHTRGLDWIVTHFLTVQVRRQWKMTQFRSLPPVWETWMDFLASGLAWVSAGCGGHLGNKPVGGRTLCSFILPSLCALSFTWWGATLLLLFLKAYFEGWAFGTWLRCHLWFPYPTLGLDSRPSSALDFSFLLVCVLWKEPDCGWNTWSLPLMGETWNDVWVLISACPRPDGWANFGSEPSNARIFLFLPFK